jgi:mannose-6-phosphate isomerase-like protein (cupin superfamily)
VRGEVAMTAPEPNVEPSWGHNPVTGELAHVLTRPEGGRSLEVDLWLQPGAAVAGAHVHPSLVERFEVLEGDVTFLVGDRERPLRPGDGAAEVAVGIVHDWWNSGVGIARVRVEIEATPQAPAGTADRFVAMIEAVWSLGALGKVNGKGMPDPLWLAAIAHEYRDVIRFVSPPAAVQTALFPALAALAGRFGRDPADPSLHGPGAPIWIEDPGADLDALLARRVGAAAAREHG